MRYLTLFLLTLLLSACAADLSNEELEQQQLRAFGTDTERLGSTEALATGTRRNGTVKSQPDTLPIPHAAANKGIDTPPGKSAPTPYGMTIDETEEQTALTAKDGLTNDSAPALAAQKLLTGEWVNTEDERERVAFTPTHYQTYYEGELLVEEDMSFHARCPDACSGGVPTGEPCFTISGPAQTACYGVVPLTQDRLELQMLGGSDETVVYRRAE